MRTSRQHRRTARPRIHLRGILAATFWLAVCFSIYTAITRAHRQRTPLEYEEALTWAMMILPFVATGALIGRTLLGIVVGTVAIGLFWFVWMLT